MEWRKKVALIPHAYDAELYPSTCPAGPKLNIRSLGSFSKQRSPRILLQALSILERTRPDVLMDVRIEIIGRITDKADWRSIELTFPPDLLYIRPPIDYLASLKLMCESDLLLLIDAPLEQGIFLPSKLIEYLGADRPILGITPPGTAAEVLKAAGQAVVSPYNAHAVATQLEKTIGQLRSSSRRTLNARELRERYSALHVTSMMDAIIGELHAPQSVSSR